MPANLPGGAGENSGIIDGGFLIEEIDSTEFGAPESFRLRLEVTGWSKTITQADGDTIILAPRQQVTLTNLDTGATLTHNISGTFHHDVQPDGTVVETYTGWNLNFDPEEGFVLIAGHYEVTYDARGNPIEPLSGTGQMISVWDELL